jgi:hypothetical protein
VKIRTSVLVSAVCVLTGASLVAADLEIGWAERDITPSLDGKKVALAGLYYTRDATNVHSRLKFTCCVMRKGDEQVLMGSFDLVSGWDPFVKKLAEQLHGRIPEVRPESVFVGCPHNHAAPYLRPCYTPKAKAWAEKHPGYLTPDEYADFILERALDAFEEAWRNAKPGGVARAFGSARIGHCRIAAYRDGTSEMYGDTHREDFIGMLEGEDSGVDMLFTCDADGRKTGVFVNAACPSQVMEQNYLISSDFAGAAREKLAKAHGGRFFTIYQLGAAGCQSPRDLVRGKDMDGFNGWDEASVEALSDRLVRCVGEAEGRAAVCDEPVLRHSVRRMKLPMRRVSAEEVEAARRELAEYEAKWPGTTAWDDYMREVHHYEKTLGRYPYDSKLHPYAAMDVCRAVLTRAETQDSEPFFDVESHIVRIGDAAFVTNPFELYLVYGQVIKARSAAKQVFLIGKCGSGGYVPTERSEKAIGYSGGVNVGKIGHQGGFMFCDEIVQGVSELFK